MVCPGCQSEAIRVRFRADENKQLIATCDVCSGFMMTDSFCPDVYFREPYYEENICGKTDTKGQWITSKRHKAGLMKKYGLIEGGDRVHGSRNFEGSNYGWRKYA